MTDHTPTPLLERLRGREIGTFYSSLEEDRAMCREAADEIERLSSCLAKAETAQRTIATLASQHLKDLAAACDERDEIAAYAEQLLAALDKVVDTLSDVQDHESTVGQIEESLAIGYAALTKNPSNRGASDTPATMRSEGTQTDGGAGAANIPHPAVSLTGARLGERNGQVDYSHLRRRILHFHHVGRSVPVFPAPSAALVGHAAVVHGHASNRIRNYRRGMVARNEIGSALDVTPRRETTMSDEWKPIETCPFTSGLEIWVTNGKEVSPVIVDHRFGIPMWAYEMEIAGTLPEFMKVWAFSDQDAPKNYCSSGPLPDDLIPYVPTHWAPRWAPAKPTLPPKGNNT